MLRRQELAGVRNKTSRVHDHVTFMCYVCVMLEAWACGRKQVAG